MKHLLVLFSIVVVSGSLWAAEETIIDPELMNKGVWAEPVFRAPGEPSREVASQDCEKTSCYEKSPSQYLDVLTKIPFSEPTLARSWVERKILNQNED